jgi:hypothetical protein
MNDKPTQSSSLANWAWRIPKYAINGFIAYQLIMVTTIPQRISVSIMRSRGPVYIESLRPAAEELVRPRSEHTNALTALGAMLKSTKADTFLVRDEGHNDLELQLSVGNPAYSHAFAQGNVCVQGMERPVPQQRAIDENSGNIWDTDTLATHYQFLPTHIYAVGLAQSKMYANLRADGIKPLAIDMRFAPQGLWAEGLSDRKSVGYLKANTPSERSGMPCKTSIRYGA